MRKLIELNYGDVIALIAEKYGVCQSAISADCATDGPNELADMNTLTVTIDITDAELPDQGSSFTTDVALKVTEEKETKKTEGTVSPYPWDNDPEIRYRSITDGILLEWLQSDGTIKQLAEKFELTDKKYIYRLNDRVKKLRLEGASIPNRRRGRRRSNSKAVKEN